MNAARTVALLGMPRTGKSTYMGAIWQLVQDPDDGSVIELDTTGDRQYLQRLGERVATAREVERTEVESDEGLQLLLGFATGGQARLDVPDLSGETLRQLVEDRLWHPRLEAVVDRADAILVMLHPDRLELPIPIALGDAALGRGSDAAAGVVSTPFEPRDASTAAKHLDALENVLAELNVGLPVRLAVVVSAWDVVDGDPTPKEWLTSEVPAVDSFLARNGDLVTPAIFGVSAQGGRLPQQREELLERGDVRERAYARDADGRAVSLVEPLRWACWG
jgi:hypothetical protein